MDVKRFFLRIPAIFANWNSLQIIFKMDPTSGRCVLFEKSKLANCVCPLFRSRFEFATFRRICILAGCDYLQGGLQGVGLKTAEEIFTKASRTASIHTVQTICPIIWMTIHQSHSDTHSSEALHQQTDKSQSWRKVHWRVCEGGKHISPPNCLRSNVKKFKPMMVTYDDNLKFAANGSNVHLTHIPMKT